MNSSNSLQGYGSTVRPVSKDPGFVRGNFTYRQDLPKVEFQQGGPTPVCLPANQNILQVSALTHLLLLLSLPIKLSLRWAGL